MSRAELYPEDGDAFSPIDQWKWNVEVKIFCQNGMSRRLEKQRFVEAVKKWAEQHIIISQDGLKLTTGKSYYLKNCKNIQLSGDCFVTLFKTTPKIRCDEKQLPSQRDAGNNSRVREMRDNSQVSEMQGNSQVGVMRNSSQVSEMQDNSQVGGMRNSSE